MNAVVDIISKSKEISLRDPAWFLENVLCQDETDPWQVEGLEAIADVFRFNAGVPTVINHEGLNRISVKSCHGPGKTHWLAQVLHWWNYCVYGLAVCTAPKEKQLVTRLMPRYRKILRGAAPGYAGMISADSLRVKILGKNGFDPDWGFVGETASDSDNMAGYHDDPQLFVIDEASAKVLDPMFPVIEGTLSTPGSVLVMIGNPTRTSGEFWASHKKEGTKEFYYKMHIKPEDSRWIDLKHQETMKRKYGADSPVYKVRCLGEFADMEENQLIALEWLEDAKREWAPDGSHFVMKISGDIADGGEDETVITVALEYLTFTVLKSIHRFSFPPAKSPILAAEAMICIALANDYNLMRGDSLIVDAIGVGAGTAGVLLLDKRFTVVSFKAGSTDNVDTKVYRNQAVRSSLVFRDGLRDGNIIIDPGFCDDKDWEDFCAQCCSMKNKPGLERIEDLVSKKDMKRDGVTSPDLFDSPMMIFANQTPIIGSGGDMAVVGESLLVSYDGSLES